MSWTVTAIPSTTVPSEDVIDVKHRYLTDVLDEVKRYLGAGFDEVVVQRNSREVIDHD